MGAINQVDWEPLLSRLRDAVQSRTTSEQADVRRSHGRSWWNLYASLSEPKDGLWQRDPRPRGGALRGAHAALAGLLDRAEQIRLGAPGRRSARNWTLVRCASAFRTVPIRVIWRPDQQTPTIHRWSSSQRQGTAVSRVTIRLRPDDPRRVDCRLDARRSGPSSGWLAAHSSVPSGPPSLSRLRKARQTSGRRSGMLRGVRAVGASCDYIRPASPRHSRRLQEFSQRQSQVPDRVTVAMGFSP